MSSPTQPTESPRKKKRWLSPTSINTYLGCPRKFYLRYIKKLKTKPNIHLVRGSAVYKTLDRYFREGVDDSVYYGDMRNALLHIFDDEWKAREGQLRSLELKEQDIAFYHEDSRKMVLNWLHDYLKSEKDGSRDSALEQTFFSKKWMLMGRIDRICKAKTPPLVIDY